MDSDDRRERQALSVHVLTQTQTTGGLTLPYRNSGDKHAEESDDNITLRHVVATHPARTKNEGNGECSENDEIGEAEGSSAEGSLHDSGLVRLVEMLFIPLGLTLLAAIGRNSTDQTEGLIGNRTRRSVRAKTRTGAISGELSEQHSTNTQKRSDGKNDQGEEWTVDKGDDKTGNEHRNKLDSAGDLVANAGFHKIDVIGNAGCELSAIVAVVPGVILAHERVEVQAAQAVSDALGKDELKADLEEAGDKGNARKHEEPLGNAADLVGDVGVSAWPAKAVNDAAEDDGEEREQGAMRYSGDARNGHEPHLGPGGVLEELEEADRRELVLD